MSRISGLFRPQGIHPDDTRILKSLLTGLAGSEHIICDAGNCLFGYGSTKNLAGGIADTLGLLVVLDGRIVNGNDLSASHGLAVTDSATLIAELIRLYGFEKTLSLLVGDFALAVYDTEANTVWLARDRFGIKPLYWIETSEAVAFASQPRALFALPGVPRGINRAYIARFAGSHYRTIDNAPEESPYESIHQLPAAHFLEVRPTGLRISRFWNIAEGPDWSDEAPVLAEKYRALLLRAVERRVKGVELPAFTLSGGLDSSSILCCTVELTDKRQHAFSSIYSDTTFDERHEIQDVVAEKVEKWHAMELGAEIDVFSIIEKMVRIHDEPVVTATWLSHFLLCQQVAKNGFKALFGGLGGDELNAGEYEYFPLFFADLKRRGETKQLDKEIAAWADYHDHPIYRKDATVAAQLIERLTDSTAVGHCLPDLGRLRRYNTALNPAWFDLSTFHPVMEHPFSSYLKNRTWQDLTRETLPCCLRAEDRNCTAFGIDHYDPFLDHELVEFMYRVPGHLKIHDGVTKQLLRRAMSGILPEATRTRVKKTGWNAPAHQWFRGRVLDALRDRITSQAFRERGVYEPAAVMRLIDEHEEIVTSGLAKENHMMFLWQLANVDIWMETLEKTR